MIVTSRNRPLLFNSFIQHSYVPQEFLRGVITPLVKDTEGDYSDPGNYRGLTIGVVFSYLFEHAMLSKVGHLLNSDSQETAFLFARDILFKNLCRLFY